VEFRDEPAATEGPRSDLLPPSAKNLFQAALLASASIRAKAVASEVYTNLLYVTLTSTAWHDDAGHRAELSEREADALVGMLAGRGFCWVTLHFPIGGVVDARALDEEIVADVAAVGWTPAA
jgi:hypothetical protein